MSTRKKFDEYRGYVLIQNKSKPHHYTIYNVKTRKMVMHNGYTGEMLTQEEANRHITLAIGLIKKLEKQRNGE